MPDTGWKLPGTAVGNRASGGSYDWSNPSYITTDDTSYASFFIPVATGFTRGLAGTNYDFSAIPAGSTIDGIECWVGDYYMTNSLTTYGWTEGSLILADDSDGSVSKHAELNTFSTLIQSDVMGGASELWSETITRGDVTDVDWGFFVRAFGSRVDPGQYIYVDYLRMKVYYTDVSAAITGTADNSTEAQIAAGGRTIIITLTNDTWVASGATFNAQRQNIIDGITSAQTETLGWNNEIRDTMDVTRVVRTNNTVVTVTLNVAETADYKITADEVITVTIPASALVTSASAVVATPTVDITAECDQELAPDTIATQTNLSGVVGDIDESVDSPDSNWLTLS
jgi:hypothetical protein